VTEVTPAGRFGGHNIHAPWGSYEGIGGLNLRDPFTAVVLVLTVLQIKHFVCDYPLQTLKMVQSKGTYLHPAGVLHSAIHAVATMSCFLVVMPTLALGLAIVVGEFLVHYHIDWGKEQINQRLGYTSAKTGFWWALGADQLVHHLTYIGIAVILVRSMVQ
jgi:uncharacterized protein DUF3307